MTPFFPYLALTALLNLPSIGFAAKAAYQSSCDRATWLFVNCALCLMHVVASIYIVHKIQKQQQEEELIQAQVTGGGDAETPAARVSTSSNDNSGSRQRMKEVMCYDPGVAIYMLLAVGWVAWIFYGYAQLVDDDDRDGCDDVQSYYYASLTLGTLYAMLVCCTFACSFMCLR